MTQSHGQLMRSYIDLLNESQVDEIMGFGKKDNPNKLAARREDSIRHTLEMKKGLGDSFKELVNLVRENQPMDKIDPILRKIKSYSFRLILDISEMATEVNQGNTLIKARESYESLLKYLSKIHNESQVPTQKEIDDMSTLENEIQTLGDSVAKIYYPKQLDLKSI